jgi:hypothetical protein
MEMLMRGNAVQSVSTPEIADDIGEPLHLKPVEGAKT